MSEEEILKILNSYTTDLFHSYKEDVILKAIRNLLDLYNKEKLNSLNLSEQLKKEKEKNKELENCLQMAKQIMTADISEDFDCMKLKEFKEYLLNEIKLNENFEE